MSSAIKMSAPNTDYDAAQALLDLQGTMKHDDSEPNLWPSNYNDNREEIEKTANLFWNCFISTNATPAVSNISCLVSNTKAQDTFESESPQSSKTFENYRRSDLISENSNLKYNKNCGAKCSRVNISHSGINKKSQKFEARKRINVNNYPKITKEIGTQTEQCFFNPNIELMESTIKQLCERIQSLESQLKEPDMPTENSGLMSSEDEENREFNEIGNNDFHMSQDSVNESNTSPYSVYSRSIHFENDDEHDMHTRRHKTHPVIHNQVLMNRTCPKVSDLVPIGDGHAAVPARLLKHINWNSYTSATRKLLTAVFSRRILATHSLTGKPSPAFPNKPAKKKLDPVLVNDIVQTVVERCSVPENVVRTSITTKCADESKMLKTRQINKKKRTCKRNRENVPPTSSGSESEN